MGEQLNILQEFLQPYPGAYTGVVLVIILATVFGGYYIIHRFLLTKLLQLLKKVAGGSVEIEQTNHKIAHSLIRIFLPLAINWGIQVTPGIQKGVTTAANNLCHSLLILFLVIAAGSALDLVDILYRRRSDAASKPIKGFLQLGKIALFIVAGIYVIAALVNRNPAYLLSGLGAMAAVLMLIFQDTILSVVASIQIGSNDMVRIGDWIEMPSQHVDGYVIEIALHTVKVQNWNKTIVTIPVRKLITDTFINWRGMNEAGGRRIKRSLFIDQRSVRFLNDREVAKLNEFVILHDYLRQKQRDIIEWNQKIAKSGATSVNHRQVTNLGTFRAYVTQYLKNHPQIHQDMIMMVRQLAPGSTGIPLEIYCFTNDTRWTVYEGVQADIFDHLLAILPEFGLWVYQEESDMVKIMPEA